MSGPHANPSSDPCRLPDVAGDSGAVHFSGMGIPGKMEIQKPNPAMVIGGTSPGVLTAGYDACGVYRWDDISSQLTDEEKDAGIVHKYQLIINGIAVTVYETNKGALFAFPKTGSFFDQQGRISSKSSALAIGLNMAFSKLSEEGLSVGNVGAFLSGLVSFARENLGTFMNIVGGGLSGLTQFMKHATIGYVVASEMQKYSYGVGSTDYSDPRYNQYDIFFGFWTSFWADRMGLQIPIHKKYDTKNGKPTDSDALCLIDIANIMKAVAYQETNMGTYPGTNTPNEFDKGGIMQVSVCSKGEKYGFYGYGYGQGLSFFSGDNDNFYNPFNNIGIGVGYVYLMILQKSSFPYLGSHDRSAPTLKQWMEAVEGYGPHDNNDNPVDYYGPNIRNIYLNGVSNKGTTVILFDADKYFKKR
jgi:hypothetical protein